MSATHVPTANVVAVPDDPTDQPEVHHRSAEQAELLRLERLREEVRDVEVGRDVPHVQRTGLDALAQEVVAPRHVLDLAEGGRVVSQRDRRLVVDPEARRARLGKPISSFSPRACRPSVAATEPATSSDDAEHSIVSDCRLEP